MDECLASPLRRTRHAHRLEDASLNKRMLKVSGRISSAHFPFDFFPIGRFRATIFCCVDDEEAYNFHAIDETKYPSRIEARWTSA